MLGSQKLIHLRDRICCPADRNLKGIGLDVEGAFFYIEGTFYLDKREGRGAEYWRPIVAFCQQHGIAAPPRVPQDAAEALPKLKRQVLGMSLSVYALDVPSPDSSRRSRRWCVDRVG